MPVTIGRRELLAALGTAAAWPLTARGQSAVPVIGYLHGQSPDRLPHLMVAFRQGLNEAGYAEGQNVAIEYRAAEGHTDRFQGDDAHCCAVRIADAGPNVVQFLDRARDPKTSRTSPLDCYLEGWAEANPDKILDATVTGYRFRDPFVGSFSRRSLHEYFDLLQDRLSYAGAIGLADIAFFLRGPMDRPSHPNKLRFWREAPRIGLTGVTRIKVGERGIIAESVTYDLNLASDMLCRALQ
jgi:hypothetical protein